MSLLITGGAGFIGSNLLSSLIKNNDIICVDNFNNYYNRNWKEDNVRRFLNKNNFRLYRKDVTNLKDLKQIFAENKIAKIIHLAARAGVRTSIENPLQYEKVNIRGTLNLLEMAKEHNVEQFILGSTSSIYGNQTKVPFSESDPVDHPISPYAATKKSAELLCYNYSHLYNIKTTCLRFFTVYGPSGRPDMAPYLFTEAILKGKTVKKFGDGTTRRDYTFIDDIVNGIVKAIKKPFDYEIINLGNHTPVTLNQFIKTLEKITNKTIQFEQLPIPAGDVEQTYADISKAKKLLEWEPETDLEEGLTKFVKWYKKNRS